MSVRNIHSSEVPHHVAVIMDGNGRWACQRGLPRTAGHKQGAEAVRKIVRAADELGIQYLTLFGFSSENWSRPVSEIRDLMALLRFYLRAETADLHKNNVRLQVIGDRSSFDKDIVDLIDHAENLTRDNDGIHVLMALNYGGRHDIVQAAFKMLQSDQKPESMIEAEELFTRHLMTAGVPDPDLLIRTSGEQRISNFLLWQCAYTEMVFTPVLWPDFDKSALEDSIAVFSTRERRFGSLNRVDG